MDDIIEKHLSKLNTKWLAHKLEEFRSSPLYVSAKDALYNSDFVVKEQIENILDDEGNIIDERVVDGMEYNEVLEIGFREFCYSSNYYCLAGEYYPSYLAELESRAINKQVKKYIYGLEEIVEDLTTELGKYDSELNAITIRDFIYRCKSIAEEIIQTCLTGREKINSDLREDFIKKFEKNLLEVHADKIQINNLVGTHIEKLKIKLNTEDFCALLVRMANTDMIDLNKPTYDFLERHVTLIKSNKTHINTARQLEQRVSRVRKLGGLGLNNILERLNKPLKG